MTQEEQIISVAERLRQAINRCELSYHELGRRAHVNQAQLSRFMAAGRDLTLVVASRLCEVLGLDLVQARPLRSEPLAAPAPTTRQRQKTGAEPETTYARGQGRRMDLEKGRAAHADSMEQAGEAEGAGQGRPAPGGKRSTRRGAKATGSAKKSPGRN